MTGIDRLRAIAGAWDEWGLGGTLAEMADQIERERAEDCYHMGLDCGTVWRVVADMERHVSGVEGAEDSPVARWARELRGALKSDTSDGRDTQNTSCADPDGAADVTSDAPKVTRGPAEDVSMSAYDLLPADEREAIAWVREHGGLDAVKRRWECLSYYADPVPRSCMEKRLARLQRQIDECHEALRRRNQRIAVLASEINRAHNENHMEFMRRAGNYTAFADEVCKRFAPQLRYMEGCTKDVMDAALDALDRRLMPEGMEWPRYESGEPVRIGDVVSDVEVRSVVFRDGGILLSDCTSVPGWGTWRSYKEPIKRPAVLAADGEPLVAGQMVYHIESGDEFTVTGVDAKSGDANLRWGYDFEAKTGSCAAELLTHRAPVFAADGEPLEVGQTVWDANGDELVIGALEDGGHTVACRYADVGDGIPVHGMWSPSDLTHQRPDSWERIEEDAEKDPCSYFGFDGEEICGKCPASGKNCEQTMVRALVRRARALAERERGE